MNMNCTDLEEGNCLPFQQRPIPLTSSYYMNVIDSLKKMKSVQSKAMQSEGLFAARLVPHIEPSLTVWESLENSVSGMTISVTRQ